MTFLLQPLREIPPGGDVNNNTYNKILGLVGSQQQLN